MKIGTRLLIGNLLSIVIALLIGLILVWASGEVNKALERSRVVDGIAQGVLELDMLTSDYMLHHEERAQRQWGLRHDSLAELLNGIEYKRAEERRILEEINKNHESIKRLFVQLVAAYEGRNADADRAGVYRELEERIVGQLLVKLQATVSGTFRLTEASNRQAVTVGRRASVLAMAFIVILAAAVTATSLLIRSSIVRPITALREGTERIGAGNLDFRVGTLAKDEIGMLSRAFDQMTDNLKRITASRDELDREITVRQRIEEELEQANERMSVDLEAAAEIQKSLLPTEPPDVEEADFKWIFRPSERLGGDMLNVFRLDDDHVGLYVLDVSGHGVTAALLSVTLSRVLSPLPDRASIILRQSVEDSGSLQIAPPTEVAEQLNRQFPMDLVTQQFFTIVYGILNLQNHEFRYVCAGHPYPVYLPREGEATIPEEPRLDSAIGFPHDHCYQEHSLSLRPNDRLYLYSDGVFEASNSVGEEFGKRRFVSVFDQTRTAPLEQGLATLVETVERWCQGAGLADDATVLAFEITG